VTEEAGEEGAVQAEAAAADGDESSLASPPDPSDRHPGKGEDVAVDEPAGPTSEAEPAAAAQDSVPPEPQAPAEEPKPVLLWRPARFDRQGGHRRHDQRQRHGRGQAEAGVEAGAGKPKFNRDRFKGPPKPHGEGARPDFRKGKPQEARDRDGRGQNGRQERGQKPAFQPRSRDERPARVDPLSPFAKLAALRDQLKK
jgi:ATP-dependent RNA helicase SUPV3L1/SUV3